MICHNSSIPSFIATEPLSRFPREVIIAGCDLSTWNVYIWCWHTDMTAMDRRGCDQRCDAHEIQSPHMVNSAALWWYYMVCICVSRDATTREERNRIIARDTELELVTCSCAQVPSSPWPAFWHNSTTPLSTDQKPCVVQPRVQYRTGTDSLGDIEGLSIAMSPRNNLPSLRKYRIVGICS